MVALDAWTGDLRWHYQFTPHDVRDYDGVNEMLLVDLMIQGRKVKAPCMQTATAISMRSTAKVKNDLCQTVRPRHSGPKASMQAVGLL